MKFQSPCKAAVVVSTNRGQSFSDAIYIGFASSGGDAGVSFAAEVNPPGEAFVSDWAIGNGQIFVSGFATPSLFIIPASAPSTSTFVDGQPTVFQVRTLAADEGGNAFVASQLD